MLTGRCLLTFGKTLSCHEASGLRGIIREETSRELIAALSQLASRQRDVLHLVFYQDLSIAAAASVLGISLGSAITISGAAASPNMGYHSSPFVTFILTLLNVRLGAWLGNPGQAGDHTFHL